MQRETVTTNFLDTICWMDGHLIDWASAGTVYLNNDVSTLGKYHYGNFDGSVISSDGQYAFIYKKLGTKGLLLKNGELLREINRSYYCAEVYEYPAVFFTTADATYLIHCPAIYNRLDFENVETEEIITNAADRKPMDFFHSRLEVDPTGKFLMSKGWHWHPLDAVYVFNIAACIKNPLLLDESDLSPDYSVEVCTASFMSGSKILVGSSIEVYDDENIVLPPLSIAVWDFHEKQLTNMVKVNGEFGNLFAMNDEFAWDTYNFPKIINIKTGEIVDEERSIYSGTQNSSILHSTDKLPLVAFNQKTKQLAIAYDNKLEICTPFV